MYWFFFGSLLDPDVLATVLGRELPASNHQPATLPGYARVTVVNESYPALRAEPSSSVSGIVVDGLSADEQRRVCFFEGDEFELRPHRVIANDSGRAVFEALAFTATERIELSNTEWDFHVWQRRHKPRFLPMVRDWMAGYGTTDPRLLEQQWQRALSGN